MLIKKIVNFSMDQNIYVVYDEKSKEGIIIDPGASPERVVACVEEFGVDVKAIVLTHGHADHIGAVPVLKAKYNVPVVCHECEQDVLEDATINLSTMFFGPMEFSPDVLLKDGEIFRFGDVEMKCLHTPGHTIGGACYYIEKEKIVFSGDTLFYGSIGRTDFPNTGRKIRENKCGCGYPVSENFAKIIDSIRTKLITLPDDTVVLSGHGQETTIFKERNYNPFL
ncbi:MAG: MBL fold metallo-hydrolase [Firmicutes bacterium]|nr:MBL fold metallo-hydrolase [Bacillota bacterium]